jgi:hypothetical protein
MNMTWINVAWPMTAAASLTLTVGVRRSGVEANPENL